MAVLWMGAFLPGQSDTAAQTHTAVCCCWSPHPSSPLLPPLAPPPLPTTNTRMLSQESQDLSSSRLFIPCPRSLPAARCASALAAVWDGVRLIQLCLPPIGDPPRQGAAPTAGKGFIRTTTACLDKRGSQRIRVLRLICALFFFFFLA